MEPQITQTLHRDKREMLQEATRLTMDRL